MGSLFAGIGGFDEGFRRSGFKVAWEVEREPFCRAVLKSRFPEAELFEDVRHVGKHNLRAVDVLTGGFPCQDVSVAGKRAGLAGSRTGLFWELHRIIDELRPPWFVLENVPGLFSSNDGADFAAVIYVLGQLGYGLAWRVLDSRYFGVAQIRRRVFIVGRFGAPCPAEVLFEPEGSEGNSAEGGEARPQVAVTVTSGIGVTGNPPGRRREDDINLVTGTLPAALGHHGYTLGQEAFTGFIQPVVNALTPVRGGPDDNDAQAGHIVIQQATDGRWDNGGRNYMGIREGGPSYTLDGTSQHAAAFAEQSDCLYAAYGTKWNGNAAADNGSLFAQCSPPDPDGVRDFTGLPQGMDSARYRALGNAVTVSVAQFIAERIKAVMDSEEISAGTLEGVGSKGNAD